MKIKEEKGITGIDITIAILVITLFISLLITLFYNLNANSTTIQRKTEATHIAIKVIEGIKANGFSNYQSYGSAVEYADNKKKEYDDGTYEIVDQGSVEENSAYYQTISVIDYSRMKENIGNTNIIPNLVKKVSVEISYKDRNQTESVRLSTILSARE